MAASASDSECLIELVRQSAVCRGNVCQEAAPKLPSEPFVNDEGGLEEKLAEFAWGGDLPFLEMQTVSTEALEPDDVNDDLQRELGFYNQAVSAVKDGIQKLENLGVPWLRPEDYYAEMVKSDGHMKRIKEQLSYEHKRIELSEKRRKARDAKKFAKQVEAAKRKEKQQTKKTKIQKMTSLRTQRRRQGFGQEFDWDHAIEEIETSHQSHQSNQSQGQKKSGKRMYKDAKFGRSGGFGRGRDRKRNTMESVQDIRSFAAVTRPGKRQRMAAVAKRKSRM